jgi:hypothetical protein
MISRLIESCKKGRHRPDDCERKVDMRTRERLCGHGANHAVEGEPDRGVPFREETASRVCPMARCLAATSLWRRMLLRERGD